MLRVSYFYITILILCARYAAQSVHETDLNFRIEPGARTCFFEKGRAGQMMETYYQVLDGQHGELDITFDIIDPSGEKMVHDYKRSQNSIIRDLQLDGDYVFCMDNSYSVMNSKLVFVYVMIEDKQNKEVEAEVAVEEGGVEHKEEQVLEWEGFDEYGNAYYIEVERIAESLKVTLKHVVKARHMLDVYSAAKARDSYLAFEETFVVDVWSAFQISVMCLVGFVQVYMIKKLFNRSSNNQMNDFY
ncbi:transmembrane emp24 domain-containing protein 1-like [Plodia interpunctella]|uniref:transmembrane emp24 domain-containing protein 1-like n=1 Tax=Plodia interpunctella TaxID=58824 RepID=UPI0023679B8E|nr:transmembrane emp24 domain-containing protein 1-like [Plodia interpunctella]